MYDMGDGTFGTMVAATRCRIEPVPGGRWMATSRELPGLMIAGESPEEVLKMLPAAIKDLHEAEARTPRQQH